nr:endolytic transglycosylase MltG [Aquabacterium sp. A08]
MLKWWLTAALVLAVALGTLVAVWLHRPLAWRSGDAPVLDVTVPAGASARAVAQAVAQAGVDTPVWALHAWFRLSGRARDIKAGSYEITPELGPRALLDKLVRGEQAVRRVTLVEGWNLRQVLQALRSAEHLQDDLPPGTSPHALAQALGLAARHPEGRFFPDTYVYPKHATASSVLRQAARAMDQRLAEVWAERAPNLPLRGPDDALVLASIVEKETGLASDREQIAGVFINRLRIGMRLQTDPSVIYGLGEGFDGRLRRRDLDTDTPYNTYTRAGLPPTPIAMPGTASLRAAVRPADTPAFYFVSRGDGSSQFSQTLDEHNAAVRRYILNR